ncbi:uncharacterized protein NECHADRAFT_87815 [Fusarium vanettenii 77-13-4]|uniref:Amino acid permease/ SLC12A domain-containing protein n=1 Tax=Fusarium vanettenii (strain ATCC MYA-4622 / CBS 123669 / FGSC 9596 / NRRL 45880 / 77-13-4) TaxID=660122 RepID=C7Z339_FUSV7|nr:uncharacterized protein NECHADRAFT_87815 [Fusarium vanettenii 77-13-4]EEU41592.1 hypothetical protein NECHADRAFT_87815 [Fusarium vanettenii 77-13-4]
MSTMQFIEYADGIMVLIELSLLVHIGIWITVMLVVALSFAPIGAYAETKFWFASTKFFMILGLQILFVVLCFGGAPAKDGRLGFTYWKDPGAMYLVGGAAGRFCAFIYALAFSVFSFNFGPELIVITGGEMRAPRKNLPRAAKAFVYRLITFYILGALAIGIICRSDAPGPLSGGNGAAASPWVIAIKDAGIHTLDSIINAGIIISAWSSGNSYLYMSSRSLYSLAMAGNAPFIFKHYTSWGLPIYAVMASSLFGLLAFLTSYIGFPIFIVIYSGHGIWKRKDAWIISPYQVDLTTGLDYILVLESIDLETRPKESSNRITSALKRVFN